MAVSFTCGFYNIPVIGIAARNSAFSDKVRDCNPNCAVFLHPASAVEVIESVTSVYVCVSMCTLTPELFD